jgi:hypothetical protein
MACLKRGVALEELLFRTVKLDVQADTRAAKHWLHLLLRGTS